MKITGGNGNNGTNRTNRADGIKKPVIYQATTQITPQPTSPLSDNYPQFTPKDVANAVRGPLPSALRR
jgi:hypothetical protein